MFILNEKELSLKTLKSDRVHLSRVLVQNWSGRVVTRQRRTQQKEAIERSFATSPRPLTVTEAHELSLVTCPGLGVATVYRAVHRLVEDEVLKEVRLPDQPVRYERYNLGHHHHFHCEECEKVLDIEAPCASLNSHLPEGFKVRRHEIIFYGTCNECVSVHG